MRASPFTALLLLSTIAGCGVGRHADATSSTGCDHCHGTGALGAPPPGVGGAAASTDPKVGAHSAHLASDLPHPTVSCSECHRVPTRISDPGHFNPQSVVVFGPRATAGGRTPTYDPATLTCSGTWCHAQPGAATPAPAWNRALDGGDRCKHCHGAPPPRPHPVWSACDRCHGATPAGPNHLDGVVQGTRVHPAGWIAAHGPIALGGTGPCAECHGPDIFSLSSPLSCAACHGPGGCNACHGAPPQTGAHARHNDGGGTPAYGGVRVLAQDPGNATGYRFECGNCHPLDHAHHFDGTVDVDLSPAGAPAGSLKARNAPDAAYVKAPGETYGHCRNVACHSSGQDSPAYVDTPRWDATGLGCDGCHGNPPRYQSGGAGTATANGHVWVDTWTDQSNQPFSIAAGHWGDFPSYGHQDLDHPFDPAVAGASPVTCQTCHYATVDPAHTGPSGFFYLDTTSRFDVENAPPLTGFTTCATASCHTGAAGPPAQGGAALPLHHVNGTRDVVFDPRTSAAGYARLPAAPNTPGFPYWRFDASFAGISPSTPDQRLDGNTFSLHLGNAQWDAATKTCSNVACHLDQTSMVWGDAPDINSGVNGEICLRCHAF
jgi:predicted CxxxxCH...CXXCH cytochrome family protein